MNLYRVSNGYYGNLEVAVLVIAETEVAAIESARLVFQNADYCPEYSQNLEVETVFFDTTQPQCTAVIECSEVHWMENEV